MNVAVILTGINPAPWEAPDLSMQRGKGGKWFPKASTTARQRAYQNAITESLTDAYPTMPCTNPGEPFWLRFFVRRELETYVTQTGRNQTTHRADSTNIQKSTEDALQGLLYPNDVEAEFVSTTRVQAKEVKPLVVALVTEPKHSTLYLEPLHLEWFAGVLEERLADDPPVPDHPNVGIYDFGNLSWWR